jgi:hypothetical protein
VSAKNVDDPDVTNTKLPRIPNEVWLFLAALVLLFSGILIVIGILVDVGDNSRAGLLAFGFALGFLAITYLMSAAVGALGTYLRELVEQLSIGLSARTDRFEAIADAVAHPGRDQRLLRSIFNFNEDHDIVFVYPGRAQREVDARAILPRMAGEDFKAVVAIYTALSLAGFDPSKIRMRSEGTFRSEGTLNEGDPDLAENLVLFCAPRRNELTGRILQDLTLNYQLPVEFADSTRWDPNGQEIHFQGVTITSPSYEQEASLLAGEESDRVWAHQLRDSGLLVKTSNPWNHRTNTKVIAIAGIRGIGTWGAAEFISGDSIAELQGEMSNSDFAGVVNIVYRNWQITDCVLGQRRKLDRVSIPRHAMHSASDPVRASSSPPTAPNASPPH